MKRFLILIIAILTATKVAAFDLNDALARVDEVRGPTTFVTEINVRGPEGQILALQARIKEGTKSLVRYTAPANLKGRSLLFVESNMWVYVPGTRQAVRISPNQQVLGGVSSADVARTSFNADYRIVSAEATSPDRKMAASASASLITLTLQPKHSKTAYGLIHLVIDQNYQPYKAVYYTQSGRALKTAYYDQYQQILGRSRPMRMIIIDHLDGNLETSIVYKTMRIEDTPSNWYQSKYLERLQ